MSYVNDFSAKSNIIRSWEMSQGVSSAQDLSYQIIRDYNIRYITVQNSSPHPVGVGITTYISGPTPQIRFMLAAGEIKHLGINSIGSPMQYIWLLDVQTSLPVSEPTALRTDANDFVLRNGINKWFVQFFHRPSYAAAK